MSYTKEQKASYQREWRANHPGYLAAWRRNNRERVNGYKRVYYAKYAERCRALDRHKYRTNPIKVEQHIAAATRRRNTYVEGSHTAQEWKDQRALYGECCFYCGVSDKPLTRDHKIPISKGGTDYIWNIVPACKSCNCKKRTLTASEYIARVTYLYR